MDFLAENKELPVIQKIVNMEKLTSADISELEKICWKELGTKEDYEKFIAKSNMICGDSVGAFSHCFYLIPHLTLCKRNISRVS